MTIQHLYIDSSYLAHSSSHAGAKELYHSPNWVAMEVIQRTAQFIRHYRPSRTYFLLDSSVGSWRKHLYAEYKAHRAAKVQDDPVRKKAKETAEKAIHEILPHLIELTGCPAFVFQHVEADDFAAAAARVHPEKPAIMITADHDYWQLINGQISFLDPVHQYTVTLGQDGKLLKTKADGTFEALGLTPTQSLLQKALMGDDSDNIKGLIGIGEGTALKHITAGTVRQLLTENTGPVTPRKSKTNPTPIPVDQDAPAIVERNITLMDLLGSKVHPRVCDIFKKIEADGIREPVANFTRLTIWLQQNMLYSESQAEEVARNLSTTFRDQWTA